MSVGQSAPQPIETVTPDSKAVVVESAVRSIPSVLIVGAFFAVFAGILTASLTIGAAVGVGLAIVLELLGVFRTKLKVSNREYRLYDDYIEQETGAFSTTLRKVKYDDITNVTCQQSIVESQLGLGRVLVSTAGQDGHAIKMADIPNHEDVYEFIREKQRHPNG